MHTETTLSPTLTTSALFDFAFVAGTAASCKEEPSPSWIFFVLVPRLINALPTPRSFITYACTPASSVSTTDRIIITLSASGDTARFTVVRISTDGTELRSSSSSIALLSRKMVPRGGDTNELFPLRPRAVVVVTGASRCTALDSCPSRCPAPRASASAASLARNAACNSPRSFSACERNAALLAAVRFSSASRNTHRCFNSPGSPARTALAPPLSFLSTCESTSFAFARSASLAFS
mmetsp:Transcript_2066/g.4566  ORF Transcript_2066/g.4566 Transcript_2066/m.4566 type:complete len:237 (-) Transcript_2066:627-1337(-)